jgi:hypothetical protein
LGLTNKKAASESGRLLRLGVEASVKAFSSEVDTGSREENASKQKVRPSEMNVNSSKTL